MTKKILLLLFVCTIQFVRAQDNYNKLWKEVEALELQGLYVSANKTVGKIYQRAERKGDEIQIVKAFVYRSKFTELLKENGQELIIEDLENTIPKVGFPSNALLEYVYATCLTQYLYKNRYKIRKRTNLEFSTNSKEFRKWDILTFHQQITRHYKRALAEPKKLKKTAIEDVDVILRFKEASNTYRPTLYDFLVQEVIKYANSDLGLKKNFYLTDTNAFKPSEEFIQLPLSHHDSIYSKESILSFYQKLEKFHSKKQSPAFVDVILERFDFALKNSIRSDKEGLYLEALYKLSQDIRNEEVSLLINYKIADYLFEISNNKEVDNIENIKNNRKKALDIVEDILENFPDSRIALLSQNLRNRILKKTLDIQIEAYVLPNKPFLAQLSFTNVDSVYFSIFQVKPGSLDLKAYSTRFDLANNFISNNSPSITQLSVLPPTADYFNHTTELALPGLNSGQYLLVASKDDKVIDLKNAYSYQLITVSQMTMLTEVNFQEMQISVLNRATGAGIKDVSITVKKDTKVYARGLTDKNGQYHFKIGNTKIRDLAISARYKDDELETNRHYWFYRNDEDSSREKQQVKMFLFMDRSIYRPGQTVFFKGVMAAFKGDISEAVPDTYATIFVYDSNGQMLKEFRLKTNEYGSVQAEFKIPRNTVSGNYRIEMEDDHGAEGSPIDSFYQGVDKIVLGKSIFSVEEYKRPKFEVLLDDVEKNYMLGDSIKFSGKAKAFLGAFISEAPYSYTISRELQQRWFYRNDRNQSQIIASGDGETNSEGGFDIRFLASPDASIAKTEKPIFIYKLKIDVTDINGETRSATKNISIGFHNLQLTIDLDDKLDQRDDQIVLIESTNLNQKLVPSNVAISIQKLREPDRVLRKKPWNIVDFPSMDKQSFISLFPNEVYDRTDLKENWEAGPSVVSMNMDSLKRKEIILKNLSSWEPGFYMLNAWAHTENKDSISVKKYFQVYNPDAPIVGTSMFTYKLLNSDFKKDKSVSIQYTTACDDLFVTLEAFYEGKQVFVDRKQLSKGVFEVKVPVLSNYKNKLDFNIYYVKHNSFFNEQFSAEFRKMERNLEIETLSFRDKLVPGQNETWSFRIKNSDGTVGQGELLASMYDASLDQFKSHSWVSDYSKFEKQFYTPRIVGSRFFEVKRFFRSPSAYFFHDFSFSRHYARMNWFGFHFTDVNQRNKSYLSQLQMIHNSSVISKGMVHGFVEDSFGPLPGAAVFVEGSVRSVKTDYDGYYAIKAEKGDILRFSFIGMPSVLEFVGDEPFLDVVLEDANMYTLDEVVVSSLGIRRENKSLGYATPSIDGQTIGVQSPTDQYIDAETIIKRSEDELENPGVFADTYRSSLNETAFFFPQLKTNVDGEIEFSFDAPQALTKWNLMLFAHTKKMNYGLLKKTTLTQKKLNVIPNLPRFLREGDSISIKAKVLNLSDTELTGEVSLQILNALTLKPIEEEKLTSQAKQVVRIDSKNSEEVSWNIIVPEGVQALTYKVLAKSGTYTDGESNTVPVLSNRVLVTKSKQLWVPGNSTKKVVFSELKKPLHHDATNHKFTLEYGSNAYWLAIESLPYLMEYPHRCSEQTFSRYYANALAEDILRKNPEIRNVFDTWIKIDTTKSVLEENEDLKSIQLSETPWVKDMMSDKNQKFLKAKLFDQERVRDQQLQSLNRLQSLQMSSGGFSWFSGGRENDFITRYIVAGFGHLEKLQIQNEYKYKVSPMLKEALSYLDSKFISSYSDKKAKGMTMEQLELDYQLIHYLYARSFFLSSHPIQGELKMITDIYIEKCKNNWVTQPLYAQGMLALILNRNGDSESAAAIVEALNEQAVVTESDGIYWKANGQSWNWYNAQIETQSLLIEVFTELEVNKNIVMQLKHWLLKNKKLNSWNTTKSTTAAIYALLMNGNEWKTEKNNSTISVGREKIKLSELDKTKNEAGTGYFKLNWEADDIERDMATVKVVNNSMMTGFGGVYWQYFDDIDNVQSAGQSALSIKKKLFVKRVDDHRERLVAITEESKIRIGDEVTIRLEVIAKNDMEFIHIKDLRAAGFEPIDVLSSYKIQDGLRFYQITKDVATNFFFDRLYRGTYIFEYVVRANNSGNFSNGMATIQSMYAPEYTNHSKGGRILIDEK